MVPKFLLALLSFALSLVVAELGARTIWGPPAWTDLRVAFFSTNTWQRDSMGAMRYTPSRTVRTVAIYGNQVEYDARFRVNNLGFIDQKDYETASMDEGSKRIAFVGDSFTAGFHSSNPWVPRLRDRVQRLQPEIEIYNLGVGGIGVLDFNLLVKSVSVELDFQKIVFLLITEDLFRKQWHPVENNGALYLCPGNGRRKACVNGPSRILVLYDNDLSIDEMLSTIKERELISPVKGFVDWWTRNTFIGSRLRPQFFDDVAGKPPRPPKPAVLRKKLERWLHELQTEFHDKEIVLIHLPIKEDVRRGRFTFDPASYTKSVGIEYISLLDQCDLETDDYYVVDGHPNERGYEKILECVGSALNLI